MTQLTTGRMAIAFDTIIDAVGKIVSTVRDQIEDTLRGRRDHPTLRVIPSHQATPLKLATHPHTTIRLSEEQTDCALAIEQDAGAVHQDPATTA